MDQNTLSVKTEGPEFKPGTRVRWKRQAWSGRDTKFFIDHIVERDDYGSGVYEVTKEKHESARASGTIVRRQHIRLVHLVTGAPLYENKYLPSSLFTEAFDFDE